MITFEDINRARDILGLRETATAKELSTVYRRLAKLYHPDKHPGAGTAADNSKMAELNWAFHLLEEYIMNYHFSFDRDNFARVYPEEAYHRRYTYGWFDGP